MATNAHGDFCRPGLGIALELLGRSGGGHTSGSKGQHKDYLFVALKSYKTEGQATWGRSNGVMGGIAKQFTNAELKELAQYIGAQPGELRVVPQSKFR